MFIVKEILTARGAWATIGASLAGLGAGAVNSSQTAGANFFGGSLGRNRNEPHLGFAMARQDDLLACLGTADEFGEFRFRFDDGQVHSTTFLDQKYGSVLA